MVDKKTGEKSKTRPRFVKQDQVCIARLRTAGTICLETFKDFPQMGRFTLRDEGKAAQQQTLTAAKAYLNSELHGSEVLTCCYLVEITLWEQQKSKSKQIVVIVQGPC